ncbi:hypothetical protein [Luteibacter aegosomatissinici]|uniref:hypothetical protein n=1 Tax=Luteibacter aegosomatissinici TaxID=2911539 RepID=UPI001FFAB9D1|nr:hypothetical protein [Luteibacter aegosomatissinici]UPG92969.1 hypothetical protein L2Y97_13950 [Luteibacter aegosomatissinici]
MDFLARVGQDAALRWGPAADRDALLTALGIDDEATREALAGGDAGALRALLGGARFIATQMPGPDEEEAPDEDGGEDDDDGTEPLKKKGPDAPPRKGH